MAHSEKLLERILVELVEIKQLLILNSREALKRELNEIASTDERKRIWGLLDGLTPTIEIAKKVGMSARAVQIFVSQLEEKELMITEKRGYPKRRMDYIPSDWQLREVSRVG